MTEQISIIEVAAAVVTRGDKYLVCQRPWHKHHGGLWECPGGKVEGVESLTDAITRELREELSLDSVSFGRTLFTAREAGSRFRVHFIETDISGELVLHEHIDVLFCAIEEMRELD